MVSRSVSVSLRMTVDTRGNLTYCHVRDTTFDINEYLLQQKAQLKSWRDVYWRLWGIINFLSCDRCGETFACAELGHCRYHPEPLRYENDPESIPSCIIGTYPCCHQRNLRFDPTQQNKVSAYEFWKFKLWTKTYPLIFFV